MSSAGRSRRLVVILKDPSQFGPVLPPPRLPRLECGVAFTVTIRTGWSGVVCPFERLWIEDRHSLRKRAERGTPDAEVVSHLVEGAVMLESTQAVDDGTEEPKKDQRTILIPKIMSVQVAIARLVTLRPNEVQPFDQALQRLKILQAVDVFRADLAASCGHGSHYGNFSSRAQLSPPSLVSLDSLAQISCRTLMLPSRISSTWSGPTPACSASRPAGNGNCCRSETRGPAG